MYRMKRAAVVAVAVAVRMAVGILVASVARFLGPVERVTLTSLSPDDRVRVSLVEKPKGLVDRNFVLRLDGSGVPATTVFASPDEGAPPGSERIIWASDGSRFVLVGRHFFVKDAARLANGESIYLMYDIPTGRLWCNSSQQSRFPTFGMEELAGVHWQQQFQPPLPPTPLEPLAR
jgi:hypothetical protein